MDFNELPNNAKIFIYQTTSLFSEDQIEKIKSTLTEFLSGWAAHGKPLKGAYTIISKKFIVVGVDENQEKASGCSMDSLTHAIQEIESALGQNLMDRMQISYQKDGKIQTTSLSKFKQKVKSGELNRNDKLYNNSVNQMDQFVSQWLQPIGDSWAANLIPQ